MNSNFKNREGQTWNVEEVESDRIDMAGFLMTHQSQSKVKLNARLSSEEKSRGRKTMFGWLFDRAVGTSDTDIWHPE